jgi:predicted transposase YdaD
VPGSFVDEALRWRHSEVLFTAPLDGHDALLYVLIEHQSSDDPLMVFRMLRYVTRIWDQRLFSVAGMRRMQGAVGVPARWPAGSPRRWRRVQGT